MLSWLLLQGWTPLHSAVSSGREKVVATLLELGVEVDAVNSGGQTPLHYAVSQLLDLQLPGQQSAPSNAHAPAAWGVTQGGSAPNSQHSQQECLYQSNCSEQSLTLRCSGSFLSCCCRPARALSTYCASCCVLGPR